MSNLSPLAKVAEKTLAEIAETVKTKPFKPVNKEGESQKMKTSLPELDNRGLARLNELMDAGCDVQIKRSGYGLTITVTAPKEA